MEPGHVNQDENHNSIDIYEISTFYFDTFLPAYADYVSYTPEIPATWHIECQNILSHILLAYWSEVKEEQRTLHLQSAYNHLLRATFDLYKSLWICIDSDILSSYHKKIPFYIDNSFRKRFAESRNRYLRLAQEAETIELDSAEKALEKLKESIKCQWKIMHEIAPTVFDEKQNKSKDIRGKLLSSAVSNDFHYFTHYRATIEDKEISDNDPK